jgi:replication-associated recombination protein RarA
VNTQPILTEQAALPFPQSLAEKYQPTNVSQFVGLEKPKKILAKFAENPYPSAWLFIGPSGVGKTSMALAICKAVAGELHHIPSQSCDLATVKAVTDRCQYYPRIFESGQPGRFHFVLVDEADRMTSAAQLAFLSKLDGTAYPPNTIFCFTCNSVDSLESRFLSRCRRVDFSSYGMSDGIAGLLQQVWDAETDNATACPNFARLAKDSLNNVRDALMSLETEILAA